MSEGLEPLLSRLFMMIYEVSELLHPLTIAAEEVSRQAGRRLSSNARFKRRWLLVTMKLVAEEERV
jgi:hypothetical protein